MSLVQQRDENSVDENFPSKLNEDMRELGPSHKDLDVIKKTKFHIEPKVVSITYG